MYLNSILYDLFRDTPLNHIWRGQELANYSIWLSLAVFGCIWLYLGVLLAMPNMVEWCIPEKIIKRHINLRVIGPPSKKQQKQISTQFMLKITSFGGKN